MGVAQIEESKIYWGAGDIMVTGGPRKREGFNEDGSSSRIQTDIDAR